MDKDPDDETADRQKRKEERRKISIKDAYEVCYFTYFVSFIYFALEITEKNPWVILLFF